MINAGSVKVTKTQDNGEAKQLTILNKGDYFGEKALYDEYKERQANVIALPPGTECYTIDRQYVLLIFL